MTCFCGRAQPLHGSELGTLRMGGQMRGTYLSESGCHDGVWMDDDVYHEGWERDVVYPVCPCSPKRCSTCGLPPEKLTTGQLQTISYGTCVAQEDCPECHGNGWKGGRCEYPESADLQNETEST